MVFSVKTILAGVATVLLAASGVRADSCDEEAGPFADTMHFGKRGFSGGFSHFCNTKWDNGLVVTGLEVWATRWQISGVRFTYSDGTQSGVMGSTNYGENGPGDDQQGGKVRHDFISWNEKDTITSFKAKANSKGDGLGAVRIEVAGKTLDVYSDNCGSGLDVNYGSGIMLGAWGETYSFPTYFTPLFLGHADSTVQMTGLTFDEDLTSVNKQQEGMRSLTLSEAYIQNSNAAPANASDRSSDQAWSFVGSTNEQTSSSLTTTTQNQFGLSVAVEVGGKVEVPFIAEADFKVTTTASYEYSSASSSMTGQSSGQTMQWSSSSSTDGDLIKPGHAKHCTAKTIMGHYRGGYTADMRITVNGRGFDYKKKGVFDSVSYASAFSDCQDVAIKDIPSGARILDAKSTVKQGKRATTFVA